jgi:hypothetical protein
MAFLALLGAACSAANNHDHDTSDAGPTSESVRDPSLDFKPGVGPCVPDIYNGHGGTICLYERCPYSCCIDAGVVGTCYLSRESECGIIEQYVCDAGPPVDAGPDVSPDVASPH